jgi:IS5 family transposase
MGHELGHLNPLPQGEDFHVAHELETRTPFAQSCRSNRERSGNNDSSLAAIKEGRRIADYLLT